MNKVLSSLPALLRTKKFYGNDSHRPYGDIIDDY